VRKAFAYEFHGRGDRIEAAKYFSPDFEMTRIEGAMEQKHSHG
jgi:hypothetical protein